MAKDNIIYFDKVRYIKLIPRNGRDLGVKTNITDLQENYFNEKITDLFTSEGEVIIGQGNKFKITLYVEGEPFQTDYTIQAIYPSIDGMYDYVASVEEYNKANKFLLPILTHNCAYFACKSYMINTYLSADLKNLLVKYRFSKHDTFGNLEERLTSHDFFVDFYDVDKNFVAYKFRIPEKYNQDIQMFLEGKYSQFSGDLKTRVKLFYDLNKSSDMMQVMYKSEILRRDLEKFLGLTLDKDSELESKPVQKQEIWKEKLSKSSPKQKSSTKTEKQL